ncbi:MAG: hypothetical protein LBJ12_00300 [Oscillospiraceae bacterium]|jgi:hypothetical protein|nr:hypothetical protein [Oscillospiraceae bacterium]
MKALMKLRFVPFTVSVIFLTVSFSLTSSAYLPYQDPTPELLQKQLDKIALYGLFNVIGLILLAASVIFWVVLGTKKKKMK